MEINTVTPKLESRSLSAETYDQNREVMFTQTSDPNNKTKPQFRKYCDDCHETNHSVSNCFRAQCEDEEKNGSLIPDQNCVRNLSINTFNHTRIKFI